MGVMRDAIFPTREVSLEPYSTLLLYTDGLIEFSRNIDQESARLLDALALRVHDTLPDGAEALLRFMLNQRQLDDIAVLVATLLPANPVPLQVKLAAQPRSARIARRIAHRFARTAGLSDERAFNLGLSVGELVANAAEHAYGAGEGEVTLKLAERDGTILGTVADDGAWRDGPPIVDRGRGLAILRAVTTDVDIERTSHGTRVAFEL